MAVPTRTVSIRVRYAETDAMGVAHHSSYIPWFELARIEALREMGHSYAELERSGVVMPVIDLQVSYRRSLHFDDLILLQTNVSLSGPSRITFVTEVVHNEQVCATGTVTVAAVRGDGRPIRVPTELAEMLSKDGQGEV